MIFTESLHRLDGWKSPFPSVTNIDPTGVEPLVHIANLFINGWKWGFSGNFQWFFIRFYRIFCWTLVGVSLWHRSAIHRLDDQESSTSKTGRIWQDDDGDPSVVNGWVPGTKWQQNPPDEYFFFVKIQVKCMLLIWMIPWWIFCCSEDFQRNIET